MGQPRPLHAGIAEAVLRSEHFATRNAKHVELVESSGRPASTVFQIRVQVDDGPRLFWVKVRPSGSLGTGEDEYKFLKKANDAFGQDGELSVVRPVAYLPDFDAVVTENVEGHPLHSLVKRSLNRLTAPFAVLEDFERHFVRCGAWLAKLHEHTLSPVERFDPHVLHRYVDARLAYLESRGAIDRVLRERTVAYLNSLLVSAEADALLRVWTHGDYAPYNVVVSPRRLSVINPDIGGYFADLGNYCSRYEDIVHFYRFTQSMSMASSLIAPRVRQRLATSFLEGYTDAGGPVLSERSAAFRAFRLKYELLAALGIEWPSILRRLSSGRSRIERFQEWLDDDSRERD
jgi:hypothetical protein